MHVLRVFGIITDNIVISHSLYHAEYHIRHQFYAIECAMPKNAFANAIPAKVDALCIFSLETLSPFFNR